MGLPALFSEVVSLIPDGAAFSPAVSSAAAFSRGFSKAFSPALPSSGSSWSFIKSPFPRLRAGMDKESAYKTRETAKRSAFSGPSERGCRTAAIPAARRFPFRNALKCMELRSELRVKIEEEVRSAALR